MEVEDGPEDIPTMNNELMGVKSHFSSLRLGDQANDSFQRILNFRVQGTGTRVSLREIKGSKGKEALCFLYRWEELALSRLIYIL